MLELKKSNPWIFWPSSICDTFPVNPADKHLGGGSNFDLTLEFTLKDESKEQKTLFCILPHYTGLDLHEDFMVFTVSFQEKTEYFKLPLLIVPNEYTKLRVVHRVNQYLNLFINSAMVLNVNFGANTWKTDGSPHIILGSGNFPRNGFNLNYTEYNLHSFELKVEEELVANHKFEEFIFDKSVDLTDNCNFLHKI